MKLHCNLSKSLYKIISQTKISRGSNRKGIIAACVYFACKDCNVPRSSKEVAEIFNINGTVMTKGVKKCQEIIHMNKKNKKSAPEPTENIRVTLPYKPKGEMFAVAETFQGGSRLQLICEDGKRRMGRIPGKLRRRMWVRENDLLIVVPWSFQDSKADVKHLSLIHISEPTRPY